MKITVHGAALSAAGLSHPKYRPDIDGLRAIAVLSVVAFHAFPEWLGGGFVGVDVFFVISGFLISTIIFGNLETGSFSSAEFYGRRIRRIFPALLVVLVAVFLFGSLALLPDEYAQLGKHIAGGAGFVSNLVLWNESGYFDTAAETKPLLHLWSLGIEEQFYVVWPLLMVLAFRQRIGLLAITLLIALCSFALGVYETARDPVAAFYSPQTRFWELLVGAVLAWVLLRRGAVGVPGPVDQAAAMKPWVRHGASLLGVALIAAAVVLLSKESSFPGWWALLPTCGSALVIFAGPDAWLNRVILSTRALVWVGLISFPLYLWHWPVLTFARIVEGEVPAAEARLGLVALAVLLSWLTFLLVEKPIRRRGSARKITLGLVALMLVVGLLGHHAYKQKGMALRLAGFQGQMDQLSYAFPRDKQCKVDHEYAKGSCWESDTRFRETVMVIGDSHMEALAHGFIAESESGRLRHNLLVIGKAGCNPFLHSESIDGSGRDHGCVEIITPALMEAARRTDVAWVVLAGRHANRYGATGFGRVDEGVRGFGYRYSRDGAISEDPGEAYAMGLAETLSVLEKAGKRVVFVHQVPELGFDPRDCIQRLRGFPKDMPCSIERTAFERRVFPYKERTRAILEKHGSVFSYDPAGHFCDEDRCGAFNEKGELLYRDDDHMSKIAAEIMAADIAAVIESGAVVPRGN